MSELPYCVDYIVMDANKIYYKGPYGQIIDHVDPVFQKTAGIKRTSLKEENNQEETKIQASVIDTVTNFEKPMLRRYVADGFDGYYCDPDSVMTLEAAAEDSSSLNLFYPKYDPISGNITVPNYAITAPIPNADVSQPASIISVDGHFVHPTTVYPSQVEPSLVIPTALNVKATVEMDETEEMCD